MKRVIRQTIKITWGVLMFIVDFGMVLFVLGFLAGCTVQDGKLKSWNESWAETACQDRGYTPDTDAFRGCVTQTVNTWSAR